MKKYLILLLITLFTVANSTAQSKKIPSVKLKDLSGKSVDMSSLKNDGKPITFNIRFHLYPGLTAVKTMSGQSVLIQLSKNKSLLFTTKSESVILEKSIFLARNKILENTCITISGNLVNKNKIVQWEIKKNI